MLFLITSFHCHHLLFNSFWGSVLVGQLASQIQFGMKWQNREQKKMS
jgi:hypothetical protein